MTTVRVTVIVRQLEPGTHFDRKSVSSVSEMEYDLPADECMEIRPDWGQYSPIITYPAIERALNRRNIFVPLPADQRYFYGVVQYGPTKLKVN